MTSTEIFDVRQYFENFTKHRYYMTLSHAKKEARKPDTKIFLIEVDESSSRYKRALQNSYRITDEKLRYNSRGVLRSYLPVSLSDSDSDSDSDSESESDWIDERDQGNWVIELLNNINPEGKRFVDRNILPS